MRKLLPAILALALLAACGQQAPAAQPTAAPAPTQPAQPTAAQPTAAPADQPTQSPYPAPSGQPTAAPYPGPAGQPTAAPSGVEAPDALVATARGLLAKHLGVAPDSLAVQAGVSKQWPDGSLGCPDPAKTYEQVIVPGYQLTFAAAGKTYDVRTTLGAAPGEPLVLCEAGRPTDLAAGAQAPQPELGPEAQGMVELAKQDLAKQAGVDPSAITVVGVSPVSWNDSSLGCAKPGVNYMQVVTPGYLVRLQAKGQTYEYHTDSKSQVVLCVPKP